MVMKQIKRLILIAVVCGIVYSLLAYHFVFFGRKVKPLRKMGYTLEHTFVNVKPTEFRGPEEILRDKKLREAGVADVMVDFGIITEDERSAIEDRIDSE